MREIERDAEREREREERLRRKGERRGRDREIERQSYAEWCNHAERVIRKVETRKAEHHRSI